MKLSLSKSKKWLQYLLVTLPFLFAGNAFSQETLMHSYTFETDSTDAVGDVDGTLMGGAKVENGALVLASNGDYMSFDGSALNLDSYDAITMEYYFTGSTTANTGWTWTSYFGDDADQNSFYTALSHWGGEMRTAYSGQEIFRNDVNHNDGQLHYLVTVLTSDSLKLYRDGVRYDQILITGDSIGAAQAYLGRGPNSWSADPTWIGTIHEFNIYSGEMTAETVANRADHIMDTDGDGFTDSYDNCPTIANTDQLDYNNDGEGNVCDTDNPIAYLDTLIFSPAGTLIPEFDKDVFDYQFFAPVGTQSVNVTATPEGSFDVAGAGEIDLTSGTASTTISVTSDGHISMTYNIDFTVLADCFDPIYGDTITNLIPDPELNDMANFPTSWGDSGTPAITSSPDQVFCGTGSGYLRGSCWPSGGSLNVALNSANSNALQPETSYRLRAMVKNETGGDGGFHFQVEGYNGSGSNIFFSIPATQGWEQVDFSFVTGASIVENGIYMNSCLDANGLPVSTTLEDTCFIDNYELVAVPDFESKGVISGLSIGALDSEFDYDTYSYTAVVPYGTAEVTPTVRGLNHKAIITGNDPVDLSSGSGKSTIVITSPDGSATSTYEITYSWAAVAILSDLTVDNGALTPDFDSNISDYTVYASLGATSVTFAPTAADAAFNVDGDVTFDISDGLKDTAKFVVSGDGYGTSEYNIIIVPTTHKHGYTFEEGTFSDGVINDQVGDLDGILIGSAIRLDSGKLIVSGATGNTDGYVSFDAEALALYTYDAITLEFQVQTYNVANSTFSMLAYFGNNDGGSRTFWYQPTRNGDESRAEANTGGGSALASLPGTEVDDGLFHHVAVVLTPVMLNYYLDGDLVASAPTSGNPIPDIDVVIAQLFKGPDGWADPNYNGQLEEFNIFNGALDAETIAQRALTYDADGDLFADIFDNCPDNFNPNQADADGDGIGNLCDDDFGGLASLSDLTTDSGKLLPEFESEVYNYYVYAAYGATSVTLTAVPTDPSYTITGELTVDISSGKGSTTLLVEGTGSETSTTYKINVIGVMTKHSYTFDSAPVDGAVSDEVGDLAGQIQGAGIVENGSFVSSSATDGISFDGTLLDLASYDAITLETYVVSSDVNTSWHMLNYFGGADGLDNVTVQPARQDDVVRAEFVGAFIEADFEVVDNEYHQFVSTFSNQEVSLYIDGVLIGSAPAVNPISQINATNAYLCLSGWPDDAWQGRVLEFNIYNGIMDAATVASRANLFDNDGDGIVNDDDDDDDNDGQLDVQEIACGSDPLDAESMSADENANNIPDCQEADDDSDNILNFEDNCPTTANEDQSDIDGDGIGDVCDDDIDGDGILNENDSCPTAFNIGDTDEDGIDEACDELSATNRLTGQNDLAFGEVGIGSDATLSLTIVNLGDDDLEITDIQTPEGFSVDKTTLTVSSGLAIVKVTFAPLSPIAYSGDISVVSNAGTSTIPVTGTGSGVLSANPRDFNIVMGPNPVVDGQLNIDWSKSEFNNPTIKVLSIDGREISTQRFENVNYTTIDVSNVSKGLFLIQVITEGKAYNFKMLKR